MSPRADAYLRTTLTLALCALGIFAALALPGCQAPHLVVVRTADSPGGTYRYGTGLVLDEHHPTSPTSLPGDVLTVGHVVGDEEVLWVETRRGRYPARVVALSRGWAVLRPMGNGDVLPGDSGSPVYTLGGQWVGAVEGREVER